MSYILLLCTGTSAIVVAILQRRYRQGKGSNLVIDCVVFFCWILSLAPIFLLPIDVSSTHYEICLSQTNVSTHLDLHNEVYHQNYRDCGLEPFAYVGTRLRRSVWLLVYWITFLLTWFIVPLLQAYVISGAFTVGKKIMHSLRINAILYAVSFVFIGILAVYVRLMAGVASWDAVLAILMALANAIGLLAAVVFLGHGFVDIPFTLWRASDPRKRLVQLESRAPMLREDLLNAEEEYLLACEQIQQLRVRSGLQSAISHRLSQLQNIIDGFDEDPEGCNYNLPLNNNINNESPYPDLNCENNSNFNSKKNSITTTTTTNTTTNNNNNSKDNNNGQPSLSLDRSEHKIISINSNTKNNSNSNHERKINERCQDHQPVSKIHQPKPDREGFARSADLNYHHHYSPTDLVSFDRCADGSGADTTFANLNTLKGFSESTENVGKGYEEGVEPLKEWREEVRFKQIFTISHLNPSVQRSASNITGHLTIHADGVIHLEEVEELHLRLRDALNWRNRSLWQWSNLCHEAWQCEDVLLLETRGPPPNAPSSYLGENSNEYIYDDQADQSLSWWLWIKHFYNWTTLTAMNLSATWRRRTFILRRFLLLTGTIICTFFSIVLFWSEVTLIFYSADLSLISRIMYWTEINSNIADIVTFGIILYMVICTFYALLRVRLLYRYFRLVPGGNTDAKSLLFFSACFTRLTIPLSYNFLALTPHSGRETQFSSVMGPMHLVPFLGRHFNSAVPLSLIGICLLALYKQYRRSYPKPIARIAFPISPNSSPLSLTTGRGNGSGSGSIGIWMMGGSSADLFNPGGEDEGRFLISRARRAHEQSLLSATR